MKRTHLAALVLLVSAAASAHNIWIRPSSTHLSGETDYVAIDGAGSDFPLTSITAAVLPLVCTPTRRTARKSKKKTSPLASCAPLTTPS